MTELGGHAIFIDWLSTNFTLSDIRYETKYLARNVAFIMARLKKNEDIQKMADASDVPVINGCCNLYHPCQTLADFITIYSYSKKLVGVKLCYVGVYNNVVNSLVSLAKFFDLKLTLVCPIRDESVIDQTSRQELLAKGLLTETLDVEKAVLDQDYVYTDTWVDMEFFSDPKYEQMKQERISTMMPYQLNKKLLTKFRGKIMHDMPIHKGYEISEELVEDPRSIIFAQAENRLEAQKALLIYLKKLF